MPKHIVTEWECDLCSRKPVQSDIKPKGSVELSFQHPHLDREFYEKYICADCTKDIIRQLARDNGDIDDFMNDVKKILGDTKTMMRVQNQ